MSDKKGHLTLTKNSDGELVAITMQDDEHRILEVVWEKSDVDYKALYEAREQEAHELSEEIIRLRNAGKPVIYVDEDGVLQSKVSAEQVEAILGPHIDHIRRHINSSTVITTSQEPLSNEQIIDIVTTCVGLGLDYDDLIREVERAHGIGAAPPPAEPAKTEASHYDWDDPAYNKPADWSELDALSAPPTPEAEPQTFTTPYPDLNDLLQETYWLGKGPNNMDTGLAWLAALEKVLARFAPEAEPAQQDTKDAARYRLIKEFLKDKRRFDFSRHWAYQCSSAYAASYEMDNWLDEQLATPPAQKQAAPTWTPDQVQQVEKEAESMLGKLQASPSAPSVVTKEMVDRFLGWKLPQTFGPDCYVTFDREKAKANNGWPLGTNLLTADEARAMLEYVVGERQAAPSGEASHSGDCKIKPWSSRACERGTHSCVTSHSDTNQNKDAL